MSDRKKVADTTVETVCGITVQLVFAPEQNREIPSVIGNILKGVYLQQTSM
jgi:hypothetical protein